MPVTAKLSRLFYDRFGDEVADEIVNWFNAVDLTYRTELREHNDRNFAQFDARLAQLRAELEARIDRTKLELETRIDLTKAELEARIESVRTEISVLRTEMVARFEAAEARLDSTIAAAQRDQAKWMFACWLTTMIPLIGLWMRP